MNRYSPRAIGPVSSLFPILCFVMNFLMHIRSGRQSNFLLKKYQRSYINFKTDTRYQIFNTHYDQNFSSDFLFKCDKIRHKVGLLNLALI